MSVNMASLMIPPVVDVRGIVLDMMPVVSPTADAVTVTSGDMLGNRGYLNSSFFQGT